MIPLALRALTVLLPIVLVYLAVRLSRWYAHRKDPIDRLLAGNVATSRPGMERIDWHLTERAGEVRWQETLRAQRKTQKQGRPEDRLRVVQGGRRG